MNDEEKGQKEEKKKANNCQGQKSEGLDQKVKKKEHTCIRLKMRKNRNKNKGKVKG